MLLSRSAHTDSAPARLAVDQRQQGQGIGKLPLIDALQRSLQYYTRIGAMAVTVDAKDDTARSFYEHYGFTRFLHHEYLLYLPMQTIRNSSRCGYPRRYGADRRRTPLHR